MRKRRTGWCSPGQGSGFASPSVKDDAVDDAGEGDIADDGDLSPDERRKLNNEAKKYRLRARELRRENEQLKAQLANSDGGNGNSRSGADPSELMLGLLEAGMAKDRIRAAMKLVDLSDVDDVDDAIEELRGEHQFLFTNDRQQEDQELPGQGSRHNSGRQKSGAPSRADLERKYTALRTRGQVW